MLTLENCSSTQWDAAFKLIVLIAREGFPSDNLPLRAEGNQQFSIPIEGLAERPPRSTALYKDARGFRWKAAQDRKRLTY